MTSTRKIAIIGGGMGARMIAQLLTEKLPGVTIEHIHVDDIPKRRTEPGERMIICDEVLEDHFDTKKLIANLAQREKEFSAQADMREFYASRRYQEPTRLRGAAAQKRQVKKSKNKGKRK